MITNCVQRFVQQQLFLRASLADSIQKKKKTIFTSLLLLTQTLSTSQTLIAQQDTLKETQKPLIVIIFGPPRSGQGILAIKTCQTFSIPNISAANLLYQQMNEGTELGQKARQYINKHGSIPDTLMLQMLRERIKQDKSKHAFLLDHIPRTPEQAVELKEMLAKEYRFLVISIKVPDDKLLLKAEVRFICQNCGRVYHKQFSPPENPNLCDHCGAKLVQREDDTPENVKKRIEDYRKNVEPILTFYRNEGVLTEVNGDAPLENTFEEIKQRFLHCAVSVPSQ